MNSSPFVVRKQAMIERDHAAATVAYQRHFAYILVLRVLSLLSLVSALALLAGAGLYTLLIGGLLVVGFAVLEQRERRVLAFNQAELLNIEQLFMTADEAAFQEQIEQYALRTMRRHRPDPSARSGFAGSYMPKSALAWYALLIGACGAVALVPLLG